MMLDVFMDVSQIASFILIGQPFFGLAQACGVLANAFLSEVAPHVTVSVASQTVVGWLWSSIGSSGMSTVLVLLLFGVLCWFAPAVLTLVLGLFLELVVLDLVIFPAVRWTGAALVECCRRWRDFTVGIYQADVLPIIWDAYKAEVEPLAFLRKKAAEATGEGTISLYVGLTALLKARLSANSSVTALAFILLNVLVTTYSMQSGLTCLEMIAAEEERMHQAFPPGSGEWWQADARRPAVGRLLREADSMSRTRYKSTRRISDVSMLRMCETLSIAVSFILLAACYNFVVALLVYLIVGLLFLVASISFGHKDFVSVLAPIWPWRESVTAPTASGSFAWAGASRLAATFTSWVILFTEYLWAPFLSDWAHFLYVDLQQTGSRLYWAEKRRWLEEGGLSLAELLQAMIIFSGALIGLMAWFGYCWFWWKFLKLRRAWLAEDSARLLVAKAKHPFAGLDLLFPENCSDGAGEENEIWLPDSPGMPEFEDLTAGSDQNTAETKVSPVIYPEFQIEDRAMFHCQPTATENGAHAMFLGMPKVQWANFLQTCPTALPKCVNAAFGSDGREEPMVHKMFVGYPDGSDVKWHVYVAVFNGQCIGRVHSSTGRVFEIDGTWSSTAEMNWCLTCTNEHGLVRYDRLRWFYPPEQQPGEPARSCLVTHEDGVLTEVSHEIRETPGIDMETANLMYVLPGCSLFQGQALQPGRPLSELQEGCEVYEVSVVEFQELPEAMTSLHRDWRFVRLHFHSHRDAVETDWLSYFQEIPRCLKEMFRYLQEKVTGRPSEPVYTEVHLQADSRTLSRADM